MRKTEKRAKRGGRTALCPELKRVHSVNARLNDGELARLDRARGKHQRGEWLRMAGLDRLPPVVPEGNAERWAELGRLSAVLGRISAAIAAGKMQVVGSGLAMAIEDTRDQIANLRAELRGKKQ